MTNWNSWKDGLTDQCTIYIQFLIKIASGLRDASLSIVFKKRIGGRTSDSKQVKYREIFAENVSLLCRAWLKQLISLFRGCIYIIFA